MKHYTRFIQDNKNIYISFIASITNYFTCSYIVYNVYSILSLFSFFYIVIPIIYILLLLLFCFCNVQLFICSHEISILFFVCVLDEFLSVILVTVFKLFCPFTFFPCLFHVEVYRLVFLRRVLRWTGCNLL